MSDSSGGGATDDAPGRETEEDRDLASLREEVEDRYDFDDFGPADMAEMSADEWEAAFEPDTWITGEELLDRVATDLTARVATREVFARVERHDDPPHVLAYSDEGYALVRPDGSVEGQGTVLRDVKPVVALCSMADYDVNEPTTTEPLPSPDDVPEGGGELGDLVVQVVAGVQVLAGVVLLGGAVLSAAGVFGGAGSNVVLLIVAGIAFLLVGLFLFTVVANARLSGRFRAEEYRERLRTVGLDDGERPEFVPRLEADEAEEE